jgi:hypothetical protein
MVGAGFTSFYMYFSCPSIHPALSAKNQLKFLSHNQRHLNLWIRPKSKFTSPITARLPSVLGRGGALSPKFLQNGPLLQTYHRVPPGLQILSGYSFGPFLRCPRGNPILVTFICPTVSNVAEFVDILALLVGIADDMLAEYKPARSVAQFLCFKKSSNGA